MKKINVLFITIKFIPLLFFGFCFIIFSSNIPAFEYPALPADNLLKNPWFQVNCQASLDYWSTTPNVPWRFSDKTQNPSAVNCDGEWNGNSARFARYAGSSPEFYPNQDALLWQVVGPVNPANKTLHFHFLFVAHCFNQLKAEIYGSNSPNGPWISVWVPMDKQWLKTQGANGPFNKSCMENRECLWDLVTEAELGSLNPLVKTLSLGYQYYKIEFLGNYPTPDNTSTGDVGGKIARTYFKVSGEEPLSFFSNLTEGKKEFKIYPNPAANKIIIVIPENIKTHNLKIFNSLGQLIFQKSLSNLNQINLDISKLTSGIYYVKIDDLLTKKIVKN